MEKVRKNYVRRQVMIALANEKNASGNYDREIVPSDITKKEITNAINKGEIEGYYIKNDRLENNEMYFAFISKENGMWYHTHII